ncbi:hypothetical protein E4V01_18715 [Methylorubrum sp. Q1]|uniref:hypothetical protein n=1 Tax=Methylorubrum sp. Q1 TaxID=2562453 RepID=UPI001076BDA9|nr:hypothetical protein [Methylorubrum sp. Q1]TFZ56364.1 hypothetical protein E4V01_18715 [Methylorubrum sp. Q1]
MTNIIRPNFGGRDREAEPAMAAEALHIYGTAAGYLVALLEDAGGPEGRCLKVVTGSVGGNVFETVAVMPATDEGRIDADMAAMAVLRALEIVEQGSGPASA